MRISEDLAQKLKILAAKENTSVKQLIENALEKEYGSHPSGFKQILSTVGDLTDATPKVDKIIKQVKKSERCPHGIMTGGNCRPCGGMAR